MKIPELLQHLEPLPHTHRMARMVHLGRIAANSAAEIDVITTLSQGSLYEQVLGLQACYGTRDTSRVLSIIKTSPSRMLRRRALDLTVTIGSKAEVLEALDSLPASQGSHLLHQHALQHLLRRKRVDIIDEFLSKLEKSELQELQTLFRKLLWTASPQFLSSVLPRVLYEIGKTDLTRLLRRHAEGVWDAVLMYPEVRASSQDGEGTVQPPFLKVLNSLLSHTYAKDHVPTARVWDQLLEVVEAVYRKSVPFSKLHTGELERRRPREVVKFVIEEGINDFDFDRRVLRKCTTEQLLILQKLKPVTLTIYNFGDLRREQRTAVFREMELIWTDANGAVPLMVLKELPFEIRANEARRHVSLPAFETTPTKKIPYIALLPWEEAMPLQAPFIRTNDAEIRSYALNTQIESVKRQPAYLGAALDLVDRRSKEQDPVRCQCLEALTNIPVRIWKEEHLEPMARIVRAALDAADLSYQSNNVLVEIIARKLLPFHSKWAAPQLALIIGERKNAPNYNEIRLPSDAPVKEVVGDLRDAFLPLLERFRSADNDAFVMAVILALEAVEALNHMPALVKRMEQILEETNSINAASTALQILFTSQRKRLPALIPRLVKADPGWLVLKKVVNYMAIHRLTELQAIEEKQYARFGLTTHTFTQTWPDCQPWKTTQLQQETGLGRILRIVNDRTRSAGEWQTGIRLAATLVFVDFQFLIDLVSDERAVVSETAIRALGRLDAGQGIPTLLSELEDDNHVRIAVSALRPAFKHVTFSETLTILRAVPLKKVSVAKEVIRIARDLNAGMSEDFLREMMNKDLHRDTYIALLDALKTDVFRDETLDFFKRASENAEPAIPLAVIKSLPNLDEWPDENVLDRWKRLLALLLKHQNAHVRSSALKRAVNWGVSDNSHILLQPCVALLDSGLSTESRDAAVALVRLYSSSHPQVVGDVFSRFLKVRYYAMLLHLVNNYTSQDQSVLKSVQGTTEMILNLLEQDRLTSQLRLELIFRAMPRWEEVRSLLERIVSGLTADALVKAEALVDVLVIREGRGFSMEVVEKELGGSEDVKLRRLGLAALLARAKHMKGWPDTLRERLRFYQADSEVLVAEAAAFVILPQVERT